MRQQQWARTLGPKLYDESYMTTAKLNL
jgi:hypothetical protein